MKDGVLKDGSDTMPESDYGIKNAGWLLDQMPYHYRHILIKLASGKTGEFTQDKIGESSDGKGGEATKLSRLIFALAGVNYVSTVDSATHEQTRQRSLLWRSGCPQDRLLARHKRDLEE